MPSQTAGYRLPYPLGTDRLMDGDDQIRKLAQSVENMVQTGLWSSPALVANTPVTATITFPVAFNAAPAVFLTLQSGVALPQAQFEYWINTTNPANFIVGIQSAVAGARNLRWLAIGQVVTVT